MLLVFLEHLFCLCTNTWHQLSSDNFKQCIHRNTWDRYFRKPGSLDNTTGFRNTASGYKALTDNTIGTYNTANGGASLFKNTTGDYNTAMGYFSLGNNTTGDNNTAFGKDALVANTSGNNNIGLGYKAGDNVTTGSKNLVIGYDIDAPSATNNNQLNIGNLIYGTGLNGTANTISGGSIGIGVKTPSRKLDINGEVRMRTLTNQTATTTYNRVLVADNNRNVESYPLSNVGGGWGLTGNSATSSQFIGTTNNQSLKFRVNNSEKLRINSDGTMYVYNTGQSVFLGESAGAADDLSNNQNVFVGYQVGRATTTDSLNVAIGYQSLINNTTGSNNIAIGRGAVTKNTTSSNNVGVGFSSLYNTRTGGSSNTGFGNQTLTSNTTGSNNTALGYKAFNIGTYSNSMALGANTSISASNQIRLGNSSVTSIGGNRSWTNLSDGRFKKNIKEDVKGLDFILKLRPVTYNLDLDKLDRFLGISDSISDKSDFGMASKKEKSEIIQTGFIAQEVEAAAKELGYDFSGVDTPKNSEDHYGLRYAEFVVPLVKAIQEQQSAIEEIKNMNNLLTQNIT
tara:strand:+ start:1042 stop:2742 length:1701 start_codon:yes stop_codon:yes gene_type:complete